ncbi:hypothetical protein K7X08_025043 [Anisodus acutangulus]|uniref:Uncharacterized protein n=1 Tax=Anisodus acutangulus TaxID=402998 RepID=A0A9Q1ME07_9SOLA|nr:hypothetical protein K7X08_025043 [Anisodus acutangulus]
MEKYFKQSSNLTHKSSHEGYCWVKKKVKVHVARPKVDPPGEPVPLPYNVLGRVTAMDLKLGGQRELLLPQQDLLVKVKYVTQETCTDVAKPKIRLERTSKDALKTLKNILSVLDSVEFKFGTLQATIHENIEDLKNVVVATLTHFLKP